MFRVCSPCLLPPLLFRLQYVLAWSLDPDLYCHRRTCLLPLLLLLRCAAMDERNTTRPLWTRFMTTDVPHLIPQSIATMGMGATVSSSSDLTELTSTTSTTTTTSANSVPVPVPVSMSVSTPDVNRAVVPVVFGSTLKSCAICLEDYVAGDRLTILDTCGHAFHQSCMRTWCRTRSTHTHTHTHTHYTPCPVCKAGVPTPLVLRTSRNSSDAGALSQMDRDRDRGSQQWEERVSSNSSSSSSSVQLIDLSVQQSWVDWFSELWRVVELASNTSRRRVR